MLLGVRLRQEWSELGYGKNNSPQNKELQMKIVEKAAAVLVAGLMIGATSMSSWAAMPAANMAAPSQTEVLAAASGPFSASESLLEPSLALQAARQVHSNCKASHIYGRLPRGKKVLGIGLAMIDCKHLSGVTTLRRAQMGDPLTLSSTSGRPRGPL
jgi:hypothetical protein